MDQNKVIKHFSVGNTFRQYKDGNGPKTEFKIWRLPKFGIFGPDAESVFLTPPISGAHLFCSLDSTNEIKSKMQIPVQQTIEQTHYKALLSLKKRGVYNIFRRVASGGSASLPIFV